MKANVEARNITCEIGPLYPSPLDENAQLFYSFNRPAYSFWQGAFNALRAAGQSEAQAFEWLRSKHPRWMLDAGQDAVEKLGQTLTVAYLKKNGVAI